MKNYGNFFLQSLAAVALPVSMFSKPLMVQMQILIWNMFCIFKVFMCVRTAVIFPFHPHLLGKMHTKKINWWKPILLYKFFFKLCLITFICFPRRSEFVPRDAFVSPFDDGKGETRRLFAAPTSPGNSSNSSGGDYCPMAPSPARKACLFGQATDRIPPALSEPEQPGDYCLMTVNPCLTEGAARLQPFVIGGRTETAAKCDGAATAATSIDSSRTLRTVAAQSPTDAYCDMSSKSAGAASPSGLGTNLQVRSEDVHCLYSMTL